MYPASFDYVAPRTLDEALGILGERREDTKVLAGGQSLIPLMKLRFARPALLVDINRIPDLDFIELADGTLRLGPLVRHNDVVGSTTVGRVSATMVAAAPWISDPLVRNLGTVAGSLAHADPQGDWASVMLACGGSVVARGPRGERVLPVDGFIKDLFTTTLEPDELITEVRVPVPNRPAGGTYLKLERKVGDYATVGVATQLELDADGRIAGAGIGLTAVASHNVKATAAEQALVGAEPGPEAFRAAADLAAQASSPQSDHRGSADYKRQVVRVFVERGLNTALDGARRAA